jgi:hypothetical protein
MLKLAGWVIGIVLFVWATVSAFSIFSELKFLVDGWTWSVGQVPIGIKAIALAIGKYVSGVVGGYREFVHGLAAMLHLPHLPQAVYDTVGVVAFSIGRGYWLGRRERSNPGKFWGGRVWWALYGWASKLDYHMLPSAAWVDPCERNLFEKISMWTTNAVPLITVYGSLVAIVIASLFGIDYVYRHFA